MPRSWNFWQRNRQAPERGGLTAYMREQGAAENAPIYKAQGGNLFDEFIKERDEEGLTEDIQGMRVEETSRDNRSMNPETAQLARGSMSKRKMREATRSWGLGDPMGRWEREPIEKEPVLETHSYFNISDAGMMHSFIGLRFTEAEDDAPELYHADAEVARGAFSRKRMVVGYGAGTTVFGSNSGTGSGGGGRLMNDWNHKVTASTETPIDITRARVLVRAIPKFHQRFNYNVALLNCNDFAMTMSRLVGARAPAELYNHATGPIASAGAMEKSAGKRLGGNTDTITRANAVPYGNPSGDSDMDPMISSFIEDMKAAIQADGGERKLTGIPAAFERFKYKLEGANGISLMRDIMVSELGRVSTDSASVEKEELVIEMLKTLLKQYSEIIEDAKKIVTISEKTQHPNVNQALWNLIVTLELHFSYVTGRLNGVRGRRMIRLNLQERERISQQAEAAAAAAAGSPPSSTTSSATPLPLPS